MGGLVVTCPALWFELAPYLEVGMQVEYLINFLILGTSIEFPGVLVLYSCLFP